MAEKERKGLSDKDIVSMVLSDFDNALGAPGGEISIERADALDYYLQQPYGDEEENRSQAITSDVADVIDGMMPSLMRMFTTADNVVSFDAVGIEDEPQAEQETAYVSHIFFKRNRSFEIMFFWMFDAMLRKVGVVKCFWEETEEVTFESYEGMTEEDYLSLLEDDDVQVEEKAERAGTVIDPETQQQVVATLFDVKFKRIRQAGKVTVEAVPPDEYRISQDARSMYPDGARMVGQEREVTRGELLEMGFPKELVMKLEKDKLKQSAERQANKPKSDQRKDDANEDNRDKSQDILVLREAYKKMDVDGDGKAELYQVFIVNETLLDKSTIDRQPFHTLCPKPLSHSHFGLSYADPVMQTQRQTSELLRQILNNLYHTNNPGHNVWEKGMRS